jgi:hypothetical protein
MKPIRLLIPLLVALAGLALAGCATHHYYGVVGASNAVQPIRNHVVTTDYDPLEYRMVSYGDRLSVQIYNRTDEPIVLLADKSYVIDPRGKTHPLRGRVIEAHSYSGMLLPPRPIEDSCWGPGPAWNLGWGCIPFVPFYDPLYDEFCDPPDYYDEIRGVYDWHWGSGSARLHLAYDFGGTSFDHNLELVRKSGR